MLPFFSTPRRPLVVVAAATLATLATIPGAHGLSLNVSALSASAGVSTLECWQVETPFSISTEAGTAGSASLVLGDVANLTYSVLPAAYDGGYHNAPRPQWVVFTSGLAYITLPTATASNSSSSNSSTGSSNTSSSETGAYISGGEYGLLFAADTADVSAQGHRTQYPGTTETVALEVPTAEGVIPAHEVLHSGACTAVDFVGLRGLALGE